MQGDGAAKNSARRGSRRVKRPPRQPPAVSSIASRTVGQLHVLKWKSCSHASSLHSFENQPISSVLTQIICLATGRTASNDA